MPVATKQKFQILLHAQDEIIVIFCELSTGEKGEKGLGWSWQLHQGLSAGLGTAPSPPLQGITGNHQILLPLLLLPELSLDPTWSHEFPNNPFRGAPAVPAATPGHKSITGAPQGTRGHLLCFPTLTNYYLLEQQPLISVTWLFRCCHLHFLAKNCCTCTTFHPKPQSSPAVIWGSRITFCITSGVPLGPTFPSISFQAWQFVPFAFSRKQLGFLSLSRAAPALSFFLCRGIWNSFFLLTLRNLGSTPGPTQAVGDEWIWSKPLPQTHPSLISVLAQQGL